MIVRISLGVIKLMGQNEGTQLLQALESSKEKTSISPAEFQGSAGWAWRLLRLWRTQREVPRKQLRLVESLALGGKRQLMLVTCAGESFLVGGGADSVETIVHLKNDMPLDALATSLDKTCR
jgi:Flagellar biosynthesis protein, FliO